MHPAARAARPPSDIDEDEDQLAAYNAFLARINQARPPAAVLTRARSGPSRPIRAGMRDTPVALSTKI